MPDADEMGLTPEAARGYESYFVPAIFGQWPPVMAALAAIDTGQDVLDVGCGTGVFCSEALSLVGPTGTVTGVDLSESMLGVAREKNPAAVFEQGDITALPFLDNSFDAVVASFILMFVEAPDKGVNEMVRVLRPGGRLVVGVWEGLQNNPIYSRFVTLLTEEVSAEAGESMAWPFALGAEGRLIEICEQAGINSATVSAHNGRARFPSIAEFVTTEIDSWLLANSVNDNLMAKIIARCEVEFAGLCDDEGRMDFPLNATLASYVKPA